MPVIKTDAFVLRSLKYGETSKIVTLFTRENGKISAIVKGARNYKSRLCGVFETMNYITAVICFKESRDLQLISSAEYKKSFPKILNDFEKIQASFRIIEMVSKSLAENEINNFVFELLLQTFERLNNSEKDADLDILMFQIELLKIMGLGPDFDKTSDFGETFKDSNELNLSKFQYGFLKEFVKTDYAELSEVVTDNNDILNLIDKYEKYLLAHTHGSNFYKSKKTILELNQIK